MRNLNTNVKNLILISLFAALVAVGAFIRIPIGIIPFTMQFLFCAYAGVILGAKKGLAAVALYVGIGLVGFPVFTLGGGPTYIFQPTFGYLIGFMLAAFVIGLLTQNIEKITFLHIFLPVVLGLVIVYICGVSYMLMIVNVYMKKAMDISSGLAKGFLPFAIPDLFWSFTVAITSLKIVPILKKLGYINHKKRGIENV